MVYQEYVNKIKVDNKLISNCLYALHTITCYIITRRAKEMS